MITTAARRNVTAPAESLSGLCCHRWRRRGVDRPAPRNRTTNAGPAHPAADRPPGQGESALGLPAQQGRASTAQRARFGNRDPHHASPSRARSRASADGRDLAGVPAPAGRGDRGVRLLCAMNVKEGFDVAKTALERCCTRDGGGPPVAALQGEVANHRKLRRSRAGVVSVAETARRERVRCESRRRAEANH
jgi:hypothetical protein